MSRPGSFLDQVVAEKRHEVQSRRWELPEKVLHERATRQTAPRGFRRHLRNSPSVAVIAELKKAAPSSGMLRQDYDIESIARGYAANGAAALSVLTDLTHFQGRMSHLETASRLDLLPVLRKDFIVDAYQIIEARAFGADAVLLIAAALSRQQLCELLAVTEQLGMDALVEVHSDADMEMALASGAPLIGINNRDLQTLQTSLEVTERLAAHLPGDRLIVSESGIRSRDDVRRLSASGIHAVLVGSHLMRQPDPGRAVADLVGVPRS